MHVQVFAGLQFREFTNRESGEVRQFYTQRALLIFPGAELVDNIPFKLTHDSEGDELEPGDYLLDPASFTSNEYGALKLAYRPVLIAQKSKQRAA